MAEICCTYCNGRNTLRIVYCYKEVNKRGQKDFNYSNYLKEDAILYQSSTVY